MSSIGTPLVLAEAMACGKAIITTRLPHIKEYCLDTVVYVDPYSPEAIAKAIEELSDNPDKIKKLGQRARKRAEEIFSEQRMRDEYADIYWRFL
jgi:glycosyltransferase involved in cell wall biosynthesis